MNGNVPLVGPDSADVGNLSGHAGALGDRSGSSNTFNGTASSKLTGTIYFASWIVNYLGNFSGVNGCTQVVAATVRWSGNTTFG